MKTLSLVTVTFAFSFAGLAEAASPMGQWARGDGVARVRIAECGGKICATNTWIKPGTTNEKKGDVLVMNLDPVSDGQYAGTAFDPQRNMNYRINLTVEGDRMTTRGCVLGGLLCKNVNWRKIN